MELSKKSKRILKQFHPVMLAETKLLCKKATPIQLLIIYQECVNELKKRGGYFEDEKV